MSGSTFDIEIDDLTLARARRGDLAARERIFRLYHQPAHAIACRVCQCPELARDVTQDAFITAFRRLGQFRGDAPFWGWLRRVVVNHAISSLRRAPRFEAVELEEHHASADSDSRRIELGLDLADALSRLEPDDRAVVWLYDVEGYSHLEIADFFGLTESFSKTRLSRARARLRALIHPSLDPRSEAGEPEGCPDAATAAEPAGGAPRGSASPRDDDTRYPNQPTGLPTGLPAGGC